MPVNFSDLQLAFEFVSSGGMGENETRHSSRFEYEGERYRSLTMIAERITGAHWSGPRFFGLTKRPGTSAGAEAGR